MSAEKLAKTFTKLLLLATVLVFPLAAVHAANLAQAKAQGMVCELPSGYLKATGKATEEVKTMVNDINRKRKAEYVRIATQHKVTPEQVGQLTAEKLEPKCK